MGIECRFLQVIIAASTFIFLLVCTAIADDNGVIRTKNNTYPLRAFIGLTPFTLELEIAPPMNPNVKASIEASLTDFDNILIDKKTLTLALKGEKPIPFSISLHPKDYGYYSVAISANYPDGKPIATYKTSVAVLPPLTKSQNAGNPLDSIFGVNTHFDQDKGDLDTMPKLMEMAGVRWARDSISWAGVEPEKGVFNVKKYLDSAITSLRKRHNIHVLGVLCYDNPSLYKHATPEEAEAYGRYAEYISKRYAGVMDHLEIWNEPNGFSVLTPEQYVEILKAGYIGVKRGNPNAFVVGIGGASPGGWSAHYIDAIRKANAAGYMDSFSIHPYTSPFTCDIGYKTEGSVVPLANLDNAVPITSNFAEDIRAAKGMHKAPGIWITEIGWPSSQVGLAGQAQQVARALIMTAVHPDLYERSFIYDFLCDGTNPDDMEHNFGLVNYDYSIRPSYVAYSTVSRALEGRKFIKRIASSDDSVRLYLFGPEDRPLLVGWVTEVSPSEFIASASKGDQSLDELAKAGSQLGKKKVVTITSNAKELHIYDWQGKSRTVQADGGKYRLVLNTWPQYVDGTDIGVTIAE